MSNIKKKEDKYVDREVKSILKELDKNFFSSDSDYNKFLRRGGERLYEIMGYLKTTKDPDNIQLINIKHILNKDIIDGYINVSKNHPDKTKSDLFRDEFLFKGVVYK